MGIANTKVANILIDETSKLLLSSSPDNEETMMIS
jgi:hypothetical protein